MNQRTRMFKTLAVLAVSMTVTTVLLAHLEPAADDDLLHPFPDRIRRFVRSALASAGPVAPHAWNSVRIVLEREAAAHRQDAVGAVFDAGDHPSHFRIADTGEVSSSPAWRKQDARTTGGAIRIALAHRGTHAGISPLQWAALRVLLLELEGIVDPVVARQATARWVTLSDDAASDASLQAHLRSEGLLG